MVEEQGKWLAKQQTKDRRRVEAEIEARELNRRRDRGDKERTKGKAREKQQGREARDERRCQDEQKSVKAADEKGRKRHLEGVAWDFDDRARSGLKHLHRNQKDPTRRRERTTR